MKVAILTDTSACLTVDKIKELNIHQIELSIEFEGSRYPLNYSIQKRHYYSILSYFLFVL